MGRWRATIGGDGALEDHTDALYGKGSSQNLMSHHRDSSHDEAAPGVRVAGGILDPSFTDIDVYLETPLAAHAPPGWSIAERYVELINSGRFAQVVDLYSDDAVVIPPLANMRAEGRRQISEFYESIVAAYRPTIIPVAYGCYGSECFQVHATTRDIRGKTRYVLSTVDHFTVDEDGLIVRMIAYPRQR